MKKSGDSNQSKFKNLKTIFKEKKNNDIFTGQIQNLTVTTDK